MSIIFADLAVLLFAMAVFWKRPQHLLWLCLWVMPFIAGNFIVGLRIPYSPARPLCFALVAIVILSDCSNVIHRRMWALVLGCLFYFWFCTALGLVLLTDMDVSRWTQTPMEKAIRNSLANALFLLLPLAAIAVTRTRASMQKALRVAFSSGVFYAILGLIQFVVTMLTGRDIFPMVREDVVLKLILADTNAEAGLASRITSICGEPRYFSAYLSVWLILALYFHGEIGLRRRWRYVTICLLLFCLLMSGSRTGSYAAVLGVVVGAVVSVRRGMIRAAKPLLMVSALVVCTMSFSLLRESMVVFDRVSMQHEVSALEEMHQMRVGGIALPLELHDIEALRILGSEVWANGIGFGASLWQYWSDALNNQLIATYYRLGEGATLGSFKSNVVFFNFYLSYGLVGMYLLMKIYVRLVSSSVLRYHVVASGERLVPFAIMGAVLQLIGNVDTYGNVLLFLLVMSKMKPAPMHPRGATVSVLDCRYDRSQLSVPARIHGGDVISTAKESQNDCAMGL